MKNFSSTSLLICCSLFFLIAFTPACTTELVQPETDSPKYKITTRGDFSGLEDQVKIKVSQRDGIPVSSILTCYYYGQTSEGYGRYHFTTNTGFGIYTVTGIIGDDIEGW